MRRKQNFLVQFEQQATGKKKSEFAEFACVKERRRRRGESRARSAFLFAPQNSKAVKIERNGNPVAVSFQRL